MKVMKVMSMTCMVVGAWALGACSILYNPNNLPDPKADAAPDAPTVVDACQLGLEAVGPQVLFEGQGSGGSRPAILAIRGRNIAPDATVALVLMDAQGPAPMINIDNEHAVRSLSGTGMAVPVTLPIDPARGTNGECPGADAVALTVQVTQTCSSGPITQQLSAHVALCNLFELEAPITNAAMLKKKYSRVKVTTAMSFAASVVPVVIRAAGSVELGDVHADAVGATAGAGGAGGGAKLVKGSGSGGGNPGSVIIDITQLSLLAAGSGGGFGSAGGPGAGSTATPGGGVTGDEWLGPSSQSSGGGGGGVNPGGGGGGSIELTAGGTLTAGTISANGSGGGVGNVLSGAGGGGSGGAILVRSGGPATIGAILANGGPGGTTGPAGGAGGGGRLRYDVPSLAGTPAMPMAHRRSVAFVESNPLMTSDGQQDLSVVSELSPNPSKNVFDVYVFDETGTSTEKASITFIAPSLKFRPTYNKGYNHICVTPAGVNPLVDDALRNCIDVAYVP